MLEHETTNMKWNEPTQIYLLSLEQSFTAFVFHVNVVEMTTNQTVKNMHRHKDLQKKNTTSQLTAALYK